MPYDDIIEKHANRVGIDPSWMKKIMHIESGGKAGNVTGSYKGLFQLSDREFKAGGGSGNIFDPEQNTMAAANKLAREKLAFREKNGRDPTLGDLYMIHQQGEAGAAAHAANPDRPAWQNMLSTGEGRQKGEAWAKRAIWGNVPDNLKAKYGSVENMSSKDFTDMWTAKLEGGTVTGTQWAGHRKAVAKGESQDFKGERPEPTEEKKPEVGDFPTQPVPGVPSIQIPSFASMVPQQVARGPQVPGATRWERG